METVALGDTNRLDFLDLQKSRTVADQLARGRKPHANIRQRSYTASSTRIRLGRDAKGQLIGSGIIVNRTF